MIFDSHAHLVSDDPQRYPPAPLSGRLDRPLDDPMTAEKLLRRMDDLGVDRAVAVQRAHVYGYDNRYVCDAARAHPGRLVAVCCIDAQGADAEARARHWIEQEQAAGLRLTEPYKGANLDWFAGDAAQDVWRVANDLGASVCLHMYRWNRLETLLALPRLLDKFPAVPVVLDHVSNLAAEEGPPAYGIDSALSELIPFDQLHLKFTTINLGKLAQLQKPAAPVIKRVVADFGAHRLMWGSDVAQSPGTYGELMALARGAVLELDDAGRAAVLGGTCNAVYGARWSTSR